MKNLLPLALLLLFAITMQAANLDIETVEKRNFKVNEEINFTLCAWESKDKKMTEGVFELTLKDCSGSKVIKKIPVDLAKDGNPVKFTASLDHPGFIFVSASPAKTSDGKEVKWDRYPLYSYGGAAIEPENIRTGTTRPADFAEFWQSGIKSFADAKITVTPAPEVKWKGYKVSTIQVDFPDGTGFVHGFLSIPEAPGKYPIVASVPGAGPGNAWPEPYLNSPVPAIQLNLNVHPYTTETDYKKQTEKYNALNAEKEFKGYFYHKAYDRDEYVYRRVWLAVNRAIDYLVQLPEYDGKNCAITGHSQGGGTALAVGSMNKNVTCIVASVPALCDHGGWKFDRQAGWPQLHNVFEGKADDTYGYFDAAIFAMDIKVPVLIAVGYVDITCTPSSVFAAYNNIKSEKQIMQMFRYGHTLDDNFLKLADEFLIKQFNK